MVHVLLKEVFAFRRYPLIEFLITVVHWLAAVGHLLIHSQVGQGDKGKTVKSHTVV